MVLYWVNLYSIKSKQILHLRHAIIIEDNKISTSDSVRFFHLLKFHSKEHDEYITLNDQQELYTTINQDNLTNTNQTLLN